MANTYVAILHRRSGFNSYSFQGSRTPQPLFTTLHRVLGQYLRSSDQLPIRRPPSLHPFVTSRNNNIYSPCIRLTIGPWQGKGTLPIPAASLPHATVSTSKINYETPSHPESTYTTFYDSDSDAKESDLDLDDRASAGSGALSPSWPDVSNTHSTPPSPLVCPFVPGSISPIYTVILDTGPLTPLELTNVPNSNDLSRKAMISVDFEMSEAPQQVVDENRAGITDHLTSVAPTNREA